ncbi:MAG: Ig-like domain-containing protein [Terriglobales bacterium]|jgi:hypothetical protein
MRWQILAVAVLLFCSAVASRAGGPAFVAGSGYDTGVEGRPLIWANGSVQYFTNPRDLSPILTGAQADALVATAFSTWTGISGVALTASQGGHLAEDVNGSNIAVAADGTITVPADITPSATGTPVGIIYDYDGTVTDALLGEGAGDLEDCFTNAVYGGPDNFSTGGNIVHALVVINGVCAATSAQLPDVQYRLVRVLGRIVGLGWSQANLNVLTRSPPPTSADFAGFPVMHFADPISCVPISACSPDASVPKMDDINALARLYPGSGNLQPAGRIYGSVYFTDASGNAAQPMQGVNVVARLIDGTGMPSRQYVVTSVSGFAFCGNAGNIIDGYVDANGLRYDRWGSNDPSLEGFFDLGQLTIPTGQTIAEYQVSVEALDPVWSLGVEPYATQVTPSGSFASVVVTVSSGSNAEQNILMLQDEIAQTHPGSGSTYASPAALPAGGGWGSWISGYGSTDWFKFTAQANRTASVSVTALDETGQPTETKLLPVIGIWELSDLSGDPAPASTPSAFNTTTWGMSRLDAQFSASDTYRVGIADFRGDGRPDYFYQASLLYSDTVTPARLSLAGGATTLIGTGFNAGLQVSVAGINGNTLSASANQIEAAIPPGTQDGTATIQVTDPVTGAFSQMTSALTYGALATDLLLLLQGAEPATPVGSAAANAIRVRAVAADGITRVSGATIAWSASNGLQFSVCSRTSSCSVLSDEAGESSSWVTPTATGQSTITIALAPLSYSSPQSQQATVVGTSSALDLVAVTPTRWVGQGATLAVPLTVEALDLGVPKANVAVNFATTKGAASLSAGSGTTNGSGYATITAQLTNQNADVQVSACVAPSNAPCQTFTLFSTSASLWTLETVSGSPQVVPTGQSFQPLVMRVTDGSSASNPVMGVTVTFATTLARVSPDPGGPPEGDSVVGESSVGENGMPVLLGSSQAQVVSTQDGLASMVPSAGSVGPCDVFIAVSAGQSTTQLQMESVAAIVTGQQNNSPAKAPTGQRGPQFGAQTSARQGLADALFAVPEGASLDEPIASQSACSDARQDSVTSAASSSGTSRTSAAGDVGSCESASESPGIEAPRVPAEPSAMTPADSTERDNGGGAAQRPTETPPANNSSANHPSANDPSVGNPAVSRLLEDKRSCRFAQSEGGIFFGTAIGGLP